MKNESIKYNDALKEVETILIEIENDKMDLEDLLIKIKQATSLIKECKKRLRKTSIMLDELIDNWEK